MRGRKALRVTLVTMSALALVAVGVMTAAAGGDAFDCNGCIDKGDVGNGAVGGAEIVNGSVGRGDLRSNAVNSAKIADGTVTPTDLSGSARTRAGQLLLGSASTSLGSAGDMFTFTVSAPAAGYVLLEATGTWYMDLDATANTSVGDRAQLGVCSAPDSLADADCGEQLFLWSTDTEGDTADGTNNETGFALNRIFPVTAGSNTFYINGLDESGAGFWLFNTYVTALYVKGTLSLAQVV